MYQGVRENDVEGTRQINSVTSGERVPVKTGDTKLGVATVYLKHRSLQRRKSRYRD